MVRRLRILPLLTLLALAVVPVMSRSPAYGTASDRLSRINHIVVVYQENHSFDNLYGGWEGVNGVRNARPAPPSRSTRPAPPTTACCRTT